MNIRNKVKSMLPSTLTTQIKKWDLVRDLDYPQCTDPDIYNRYGEKMAVYYLCDLAFRMNHSNTVGQEPRYIYWDRARYNLKNHFYTDDMIFLQKGKPVNKYGMILEPESWQPKKIETILKDTSRFRDYKCIFTHSSKLLQKLPNAYPLIPGGVYTDINIDPEQFERKEKNVSLVSSRKRTCKLHQFRFALAQKYEHSTLLDCMGTFNGGDYVRTGDVLEKYRYSVVIENFVDDYYITERICNCFATMTVPIYLGSPKIGEIFNPDGIISITENDFDKMDQILAGCSEKDYRNRLDAIKDNYERVKKFVCTEDWLFQEYSSVLQVE